MGQKTHPLGFRLGITQTHKSNWYSPLSQYANILREDDTIRTYIGTISKSNSISKIQIYRNGLKDQIQLIISEIKNETKVVKSDILTREFSQANDLIVKQFSSASSVIHRSGTERAR